MRQSTHWTKIAASALVLFFALCGVSLASDDPAEALAVEANEAVEAPACDLTVAPASATTLDMPSTLVEKLEQAACNCRDLCRSDSQCELFYGPGSVCEPTGPCGCKECFAVM